MTDLALIHRVLPAAAGDPPHPCILLLHGRGTNENDLLPLGPELDSRLFTVSARAPFEFPWGGYAWYNLDPSGVGFPDEISLQGSLDRLREFLGQITEAYPIDPGRLYTAGFSMGSVMAGTLGLAEPDRVAGSVILSGYLPIHNTVTFRPEGAAGHRFFQAHGLLDDVIPVSFGRETRAYLAATPVDLTYKEYPMGHEVGQEELRDLRLWMAETLDERAPDTTHQS